MQRLHRLTALSPADRRLTVEAAVWLTVACAVLALLPFRWIAARLGTLEGGGTPPSLPADARQRAMARRIGQAVQRVASRLPWPARCLPQAIAAKAMLQRRGIACVVHFGMRLSDDAPGRRMEAHAWVTVGETGVIGIPASTGFTVLARFTHGPPPGQPAQ